MTRIAFVLSAALLTACSMRPAPMAPAAAPLSADAVASGWFSKAPKVRATTLDGQVAVDVNSRYLKDPSFVDDGRPVGGQRYIAFGDLRQFHLKAFSVATKGGPLSFQKGEQPIKIAGLPARLDTVWAPQIIYTKTQALLLYCAGEMPAPHPPSWDSFKLRQASMPLKSFQTQLAAGQAVTFTDHGPILTDLAPFGADYKDFGVIDPQFYLNPKGRAVMTYTVVRPGIEGKRPHEEFVRYRAVDPTNPAKALGPDSPLYDGLSRSEDDGVAEAQDVVTLKGQTYIFISSRPGDTDQRLLIAPLGPDLGKVPRPAVKPFMLPGSQPWKSRALGSSGTAVIEGTPYMIYQGMDNDYKFTLGWTTLAVN